VVLLDLEAPAGRGAGEDNGGSDMEAYLPVAQPSAALHQPACCDGDQRDPQHDEGNQENQENDIGSFGSGGGLIQRACTLLVVAGVGLMQLVWVALLAYATYATWQRLPL
jgi:hypothetical protein